MMNVFKCWKKASVPHAAEVQVDSAEVFNRELKGVTDQVTDLLSALVDQCNAVNKTPDDSKSYTEVPKAMIPIIDDLQRKLDLIIESSTERPRPESARDLTEFYRSLNERMRI